MIKVVIEKASDLDYEEVKHFRSYKELIRYLKKKYPEWVIEFRNDIITAVMYDDYIE